MCIVLAVYGLTYGQPSYNFIPFESTNHQITLSQGLVQALLQDKKGFLWIGTKDGLNRFDGTNTRIFRNNPFDKRSLIDNRIFSIVEDSQNLMWIGTESGLSVFDPETELFHRLPEPIFEDYPLIFKIYIDKQNQVWVFSRQARYFYKIITTGKSKDGSLAFDVKRFDTPRGELIKYIYEIEPGRYWALTKSGMLEYFPNNTDGQQWKDWEIEKYTDDPEFECEIQGDLIFEGRDNKIWIVTHKEIISYNIKTEQVKNYPIKILYNPHFNLQTDAISLAELEGGNVLIGTGGGMLILDQTSGIMIFKPDGSKDDEKIGHGIPVLMVDRGGVLWCGTRGYGLLKSDRNSNRFQRSMSSKDHVFNWKGTSVRSVFQNSEGYIFISSTYDDIRVKAPDENEFKVLEIGHLVFSIVEDKSGSIWTASHELREWRRINGQWRNVRSVPFPFNPVHHGVSLAIDHNNAIWMAGIQGIYRLDPERKNFESYPYERENINDYIFTSEYPTINVSSKEYIWVGHPKGLIRFDRKSQKIIVYRNDPSDPKSLSNNNIRSIQPDPNEPEKYLWLGTAGGGLQRFDQTTGEVMHITDREGLRDLVVYGVLADLKNNLWMSTNHGISVYDIQSSTIKNFDRDDGLQDNEFNACAYSRSSSGDILFGGINGINRFNPEAILTLNLDTPQIAFTELMISNKPVRLNEGPNIFNTSIAYTNELILNPDQKSFSLEFSAMDFTNPNQNQYAYKLEGYDDHWQQVGNRKTATYTNLKPGKYTFLVKASNNDGIWNEKGISLPIRILPPFYRTWWAYGFYILLIGGVFFYLRGQENKQQALAHQLELEKVQGENLKQLDQMKSQFFANISHEFRTPLTLIMGQTESARKMVTDEVVGEKLDVVLRNEKQLLTLIHELLDLSKVEAGKMDMHMQWIDLSKYVRMILSSFEILGEQQKIKLTWEGTKEVLPFYGDEEKLFRIFNNLISNAIKFTPEGGEIKIKMERRGSELQIAVEDNGMGIEATELPFIFDRFFQGTQKETFQQGTGLGLTIVKEFVHLHEGTIAVESTIGKGTNFTIVMPLKTSSMGEELVQPSIIQSIPAVIASKEIMTNGKTAHILLVEDHAELADLVKTQLGGSGYEVRWAKNGNEGLSFATENIPDLIISDVMMPGISGFEFADQIRNEPLTSHIPIILLTAKGELQDKLQGWANGADEYITKPFREVELLARISNLLKQRKLLREKFTNSPTIAPDEVSPHPVDQAFVTQVIDIIDQKMGDPDFTVEILAKELFMSSTKLTRKLNALIDQTPGQLIRLKRLSRAAELLKDGQKSINDIAYEVGFNVPENFTRSFKQQYGVPPSEFKEFRV